MSKCVSGVYLHLATQDNFDEPLPSASQKLSSRNIIKRRKKDFITTTLVAALDRCQFQLGIRDSVSIPQATEEALDLSCDDFPINKSSIQRIRTYLREDRAKSIK